MEAIELLEMLDNLDDNSEDERRPRILKRRKNLFEEYDNFDFFRRFRIKKTTALLILQQIENQLEFHDDRNASVSPMNQLLLSLRFLATGSHQIEMGDYLGVSQSTVSRILKRVLSAVIDLSPHYIKFPERNEERDTIKQQFYEIGGFPNVVGTIDCTHVKIQSPGGNDAELFRNRKGYFSINVQTVAGPDLKIMNIVARWPGSTHDSAIFQNSQISLNFEMGRYPNCLLLGDSGYRLTDYLMTPFLNPRTNGQIRYNTAHIRTRNTVERQNGVLKQRFPVLALGIRLKLETAIEVILACAVLHNICIIEKEEQPPQDLPNVDEYIDNGQIPEVNNQNVYGVVREVLVNTYFD